MTSTTYVSVSRLTTAHEQVVLHLMHAVASAIINDRLVPDTRIRAPRFRPISPAVDKSDWRPDDILMTSGKSYGSSLRKGGQSHPTGRPQHHRAAVPVSLPPVVAGARLLALQAARNEEEGQQRDERNEQRLRVLEDRLKAGEKAGETRPARGITHLYTVHINRLVVTGSDHILTVQGDRFDFDLSDFAPEYTYQTVTLRLDKRGQWSRIGPKDKLKSSDITRTERSTVPMVTSSICAAYQAIFSAREMPVNYLLSRGKYQINPQCPKNEVEGWRTLAEYILHDLTVQERTIEPWERTVDAMFAVMNLKDVAVPRLRSA